VPGDCEDLTAMATPRPSIHRVRPLAGAASALDALRARDTMGKLVLEVTGGD
jgi:hypothetical protein